MGNLCPTILSLALTLKSHSGNGDFDPCHIIFLQFRRLASAQLGGFLLGSLGESRGRFPGPGRPHALHGAASGHVSHASAARSGLDFSPVSGRAPGGKAWKLPVLSGVSGLSVLLRAHEQSSQAVGPQLDPSGRRVRPGELWVAVSEGPFAAPWLGCCSQPGRPHCVALGICGRLKDNRSSDLRVVL